MKKRILALATVSVLLVTAFAACKKEDKNDIPEATPTTAVSEDNAGDATDDKDLTVDTDDTTIETIAFGGEFSRDNGNLSFYIAENGWRVTGYHYGDDLAAGPVVINGTTTLGTDGPVFLYSDDENELSFTFATKSLTVAVTKGTAYKVFEGTYDRVVQTAPAPEILSPESGSSLELLGRVALTHYMVKADGLPECMINLSEATFDNAYMTDFLTTYANLFLSTQATFVPEVSETALLCSISKEALNDLFLTASAGACDASAFDGSAKNIVAKDDMYYIPCDGSFAGGLTVDSLDQELVSDTLVIHGVVAKNTGTRYDMIMTLATSADSAAGTAGVRMNTVTYKQAQ